MKPALPPVPGLKQATIIPKENPVGVEGIYPDLMMVQVHDDPSGVMHPDDILADAPKGAAPVG